MLNNVVVDVAVTCNLNRSLISLHIPFEKLQFHLKRVLLFFIKKKKEKSIQKKFKENSLSSSDFKVTFGIATFGKFITLRGSLPGFVLKLALGGPNGPLGYYPGAFITNGSPRYVTFSYNTFDSAVH